MHQKLPPWPPRASGVKNLSALSRRGICNIVEDTTMQAKAPTTSSPAGARAGAEAHAHAVPSTPRNRRTIRRQRELDPTAVTSVLDVPIFGGYSEIADTMDCRLDCSWESGCTLSSIDPRRILEHHEHGGGVEQARPAAAVLPVAGISGGSGNGSDNNVSSSSIVLESASNARDLTEFREGKVGQRVRFSPQAQTAVLGKSPTPGGDIDALIPGHEGEEGAADDVCEQPVSNKVSEILASAVVAIELEPGGVGGRRELSIPKSERAVIGRLQRRSAAEVIAEPPNATPSCAAQHTYSCTASAVTPQPVPSPVMTNSSTDADVVPGCLVQYRSGMHTSWRRRQRAEVHSAVDENSRSSVPPPPPSPLPPPSTATETILVEDDCSSSFVLRRLHCDASPPGAPNDVMHLGADELILPASSGQEQQQQQLQPVRIFLRREKPALSSLSNNTQNRPISNTTPASAFFSPSVSAKGGLAGGARRVTAGYGRSNGGVALQLRGGGGGRTKAVPCYDDARNPCYDDARNPLCGTSGRQRQPTAQHRLALARGRTPTSSTDSAGVDSENSPLPPAKALLLSSAAVRQNLARVARASKIGTKADPVTLYRQSLEAEKSRRVNSARRSMMKTRANSSDGAGDGRSAGRQLIAGGPVWERRQVGRSRRGLTVSWR